jgi:hypothetical protein
VYYIFEKFNTCRVRRVIEWPYCIKMALLIKTIAIEAIPYDTAATKLHPFIHTQSSLTCIQTNQSDNKMWLRITCIINGLRIKNSIVQ